jgi:hypothetical protein
LCSCASDSAATACPPPTPSPPWLLACLLQVVREVRAAALVPNWDSVGTALLRLKALPLGIAHVAAQEMELFGEALGMGWGM